MATDSYDIVIVGGGPAGCAAAIAAREHQLRALVIECGAEPVTSPCAGWVGAAAAELCRCVGVDPVRVGTAFSGLRIRSWDFKHCSEVDDPALSGVVVQTAVLGRALLAALEAAGIAVQRRTSVQALHLGEAAATLRLSTGCTVVGQLVVIADGVASPTAELARVAAAREMARPQACAVAVFPTPRPGSGMDVVLGTGRGLKLATITRGRDELRVSLLTHDASAPATVQLMALLTDARSAGAIPREFDAPALPAPCLAGVALEMDTHVGKRCLLIGDAGGFVTSFSNEGLYPALRSGALAAEATARALRASVLQDELASFSAAWRADLADYLRMPSTDLGLLLPVVFSNRAMARRVARAFLLGQAF